MGIIIFESVLRFTIYYSHQRSTLKLFVRVLLICEIINDIDKKLRLCARINKPFELAILNFALCLSTLFVLIRSAK